MAKLFVVSAHENVTDNLGVAMGSCIWRQACKGWSFSSRARDELPKRSVDAAVSESIAVITLAYSNSAKNSPNTRTSDVRKLRLSAQSEYDPTIGVTSPPIHRFGYLTIAIALASVTVGLLETTANAAPDPIMVAQIAEPDGSFGAPGEVQPTVERPHDDDGAPTPQYYTTNCPARRALWRDTLLEQLATTFDFDNINSSIAGITRAFCLLPNYIHGITSDDIGILADSVNLPYVIRFIKQSNNSAILAFQVRPEKAGDKSNWPTPAICIDAIRLDEQAERDGYKLKSRFIPPTSHAYFQTSRAGPRWQKLYMYFNHSGCLTSLTTFYCNENKPNC